MKMRLVVLAAVFATTTAFAGDRSTAATSTRVDTGKKVEVTTTRKKATRSAKTEEVKTAPEVSTRAATK